MLWDGKNEMKKKSRARRSLILFEGWVSFHSQSPPPPSSPSSRALLLFVNWKLFLLLPRMAHETFFCVRRQFALFELKFVLVWTFHTLTRLLSHSYRLTRLGYVGKMWTMLMYREPEICCSSQNFFQFQLNILLQDKEIRKWVKRKISRMKSFCWLLVHSRNETCVRKVWVEVHGRTVLFYNYKGLAEDKFASHCVLCKIFRKSHLVGGTWYLFVSENSSEIA